MANEDLKVIIKGKQHVWQGKLPIYQKKMKSKFQMEKYKV